MDNNEINKEETKSDNCKKLYEQGLYYAHKREYSKAIEYLERALPLAPNREMRKKLEEMRKELEVVLDASHYLEKTDDGVSKVEDTVNLPSENEHNSSIDSAQFDTVENEEYDWSGFFEKFSPTTFLAIKIIILVVFFLFFC